MRALKVILFLSLIFNTACVRKFAINKLGDALANSGTVFASDDDPELIASAAPFSLKLIESLLAETPNHTGLLLAASRGFTQYAFAFVQAHAEEIESDDFDESYQQQARARRLYLRARDYGLRGLETRHRGFRSAFAMNSRAVSQTTKSDVALLYWTAASWGSAISISKDRPDLIAEQPMVEALIDRAFELEPSFESGAIHGFLISYEPSRPGGEGDPYDRSRRHFDQAVQLSKGLLASPYIALAETVSQKIQDRREFERLLKQALAIDVNAKPEWKLENLVMQRRARWLLSRADELFLKESPGGAIDGSPGREGLLPNGGRAEAFPLLEQEGWPRPRGRGGRSHVMFISVSWERPPRPRGRGHPSCSRRGNASALPPLGNRPSRPGLRSIAPPGLFLPGKD